MKNYFLLFVFCFTFLSIKSQVTDLEDDLKNKKTDTIADGWRTGGVFGANFSQVSLNNWAAGGQNSISVNSILSLFAHYKKGKDNWDNYLDMGYGIVKQGKTANFIKSDDKIELTSKYGRKAAKNLYYAGLLNFRSQFDEGFNFPDDSSKISDFMAPGYFLGAIGMDYKKGNLTLFISPLTAKVTVVADDLLAAKGAFGVEEGIIDTNGRIIEKGNNIRSEVGGYLRMMYNRKLVENVKFNTSLALFSNYNNNPENIDINWDVLVSMKVNKYISATVSTSLIYDDDIDIQVLNDDGSPKLGSEGNPIVGPRTQFKYTIGVGLSYSFGVEDERN